MRVVLVCVLSGCLSLSSFAIKCEVRDFYLDRERGWFWNRVCIEEERKEKEREVEKVVRIPWDRLGEMTPSEIKKLREEALEIAVMNPTYENVKELKKLELYIMKRSEKFQQVATLVYMTDPEIASYVADVPISTAGRIEKFSHMWDEIYRKLAEYRDRAGLIVAESKTCPYCKKQKEVLELMFKSRTGWAIRYVDIEENPAFAVRMSVYAVPDIFVAIRGRERFLMRVATGFISLDELVMRVYRAIEIYEGGGLWNAKAGD